jgi:hypothetical protein
MTTTGTQNPAADIDYSDPAMWIVPENQHPWAGRRVRYMGREWHLAGTEWTVASIRDSIATLSRDGGTGTVKVHTSMLAVI